MSEREIFFTIIAVWLVVAASVFAYLLFSPAPYGRHGRKGWGPMVGAKTGWLIMECPAVFVMVLMLLIGIGRLSLYSALFFVMWEFHYVYRTFLFPRKFRGQPKPMPLVIAGSGFFFNLVNGYLNGRWLFHFSEGYPATWWSDPRFFIGFALFFAGFAIHYTSDDILLNLREPGETGYKIPRGGMFRLVTCPNYFGESLQWLGFAIATWSPAAWLFVVWTLANLLPRALSHHQWYRKTFPDYPKERRAIFPFIL